MEYNTSELCDLFADQVDVLDPILSHFGGRQSFGGLVSTVKCFEDNQVIYQALNDHGEGRVLVIDGGGSTRRALIDKSVIDAALNNNWEGIVCYGAVRDVDLLFDMDIGICALTSIPVGCNNYGQGEIDTPINFAGVTFIPDDHIYVDSTGLILSQEKLDIE